MRSRPGRLDNDSGFESESGFDQVVYHRRSSTAFLPLRWMKCIDIHTMSMKNRILALRVSCKKRNSLQCLLAFRISHIKRDSQQCRLALWVPLFEGNSHVHTQMPFGSKSICKYFSPLFSLTKLPNTNCLTSTNRTKIVTDETNTTAPIFAHIQSSPHSRFTQF